MRKHDWKGIFNAFSIISDKCIEAVQALHRCVSLYAGVGGSVDVWEKLARCCYQLSDIPATVLCMYMT